MKKVLSVALASAMVLGMGVSSFAITYNTSTNDEADWPKNFQFDGELFVTDADDNIIEESTTALNDSETVDFEPGDVIWMPLYLSATLHTGGPVMAGVCGGMSALFLVLGVVLLALKADVFFYAFCFAAAALLLIFLFFCYKPVLRAVLKKSLAGKEAVHRFVFREDGFELKSERGEQITAKGTVAYADLRKAVEYADMWILYLDRSTVLAVARGGMTQGKAEDLSVLFGVKLGERFVSHVRAR